MDAIKEMAKALGLTDADRASVTVLELATEGSRMYAEAQLGFIRPFSVKREEGETPNGNQFGGRWVVRDAAGEFVDVDQYRNDLGPRILKQYGETLVFPEVE